MYRSILVPLDGSPVGERAIPIALRVARHAGAQVDLAHVHEAIVLGGGIPMIDTRLDTEVKNGMRTALERLRERIATRAGVTLTASFLEGEIVPELLAHVKAREIDLVVMTTHGRGGVSRVWLGSVADALVRQLRIPVLLGRRAAVVRGGAKAPPFRRVLVPLDGSAFAEDVLAHAVALGAPDHTEYLLLRVVTPLPTAPALFPNTIGQFDQSEFERQEREAATYLATLAEKMRRPGVLVTTRVVVQLQPARTTLEIAREWKADLIALATHGEGALTRLVFGSVADKIIRGATVPLLVVRPATLPETAPLTAR